MQRPAREMREFDRRCPGLLPMHERHVEGTKQGSKFGTTHAERNLLQRRARHRRPEEQAVRPHPGHHVGWHVAQATVGRDRARQLVPRTKTIFRIFLWSQTSDRPHKTGNS